MMTLRETSLPLELLHLREGETVVGYQILSGKITFKVVSVTESAAPTKSQKMKLGDWGRKWAGSVKFHEGETVQSIRDAAMTERFGS
jgi:hypothetical protein